MPVGIRDWWFPGSATFHDTALVTMSAFAGGIGNTKDLFSTFQK
jgi:hypothetical protein